MPMEDALIAEAWVAERADIRAVVAATRGGPEDVTTAAIGIAADTAQIMDTTDAAGALPLMLHHLLFHTLYIAHQDPVTTHPECGLMVEYLAATIALDGRS